MLQIKSLLLTGTAEIQLLSYKEIKVVQEDDFIDVCALTHLVSRVILHFIKLSTHTLELP